MPMAAPGPGMAKFSVFEFSPETGELRKQGVRVRLQEQPARILELLLRSEGRVVTRDELRDALWPADTFVDFDHGLNTAVRKLRTALDDSADSPRYIETLAKRGYRLLVPVEWSAPESGQAPTPAVQAPATQPDNAPAVSPAEAPVARRSGRSVLLALAGIAIAVLAAWALLRPPSAEPPAHRTIAVLPIENVNPDTAYISEGIAEAIIDGLSTSPAVRVTSRTSSFHYRTTPVDPRTIGRDLDVTAIVTGRLEQRGDEYRLRLELVDTEDGAQLWAKDYRQNASSLDTLRARATSDLSFRLGASGAEQTGKVMNREAYDLYLRGRYHWNLRTQSDQRRAAEYFQRAVAIAPRYAPAWAGLANAYGTLVGNSMVPGSEEETQLKSIDAAKRAIELDPSNAEAYASLAASKLSYYRDYPGAERDFKRAIALNPSNAIAHHWYSTMLMKVGREDEARREADLGWRLDPYSMPGNSGRCFGRFLSRRYDEVLELGREAERRDPEMRLTSCLVWANVLKGDAAGAAAAESARFPERAAALTKAIADRGMEGYLRAHLAFLPESLDYDRAAVLAQLGERDAAFEQLERAFVMHRANVGFLWVDPRFDPLREDPRFLDLAVRLELPQAKAAAAQRNATQPSPAPAGGRSGM